MEWLLIVVIVALSTALVLCYKRFEVMQRKILNLETHVDLLNKAVSAADAGIFYHHIETGVTIWDERSLAIFGLGDTHRAIAPGTWERMIHPDDEERIIGNMVNLMTGPDNIFKHQYRIVRPDNEVHWVSAAGFIIRRDNKPIEVSGFHFDITQRMRHAQMLEQSKVDAIESMNAKSRFLANMSHEIRTPMNAIMGVIELLEHESTLAQLPYLKTLRNSSDVLLRIINDILDVSKMEAGKLKLERQSFDIRGAISQCFAVYQQHSMEKNILLTGRVDSRVPELVMGDSARLQQVLMNLLSNAIKFTESGEVILRLVVEENTLFVSIEDTGIGIGEEHLPGLFERFTQADAASALHRDSGTGLGLSIAKNIVELWGGEISVNSRIGEGSVFSFSMPISEDVRGVIKNKARVLLCTPSETLHRLWLEDPMAPEITWIKGDKALSATLASAMFDHVIIDCGFTSIKTTDMVARVKAANPSANVTLIGCDRQVEQAAINNSDAQVVSKPLLVSQLYRVQKREYSLNQNRLVKKSWPSFHGLKVLAVDDNSTNLQVLSGLLKRFEIDCDMVESGQRAVDLATTQHFDVIFMDYDMPQMDGLDATRRIHAHNDTLIIGLSAHVGDVFEQEALAAGMAGFLTKPISTRELEKILRQHFMPLTAASPVAEV